MCAASQASACPCVQMLWATGSKPESPMETDSETKRPACQISLISYREREMKGWAEAAQNLGWMCSVCVCVQVCVCVCVCVGTCECVSDSMVHL